MNEENKEAAAKKTTMQNVVQEMLPDDLKKQFVLQKNTAGALEKATFKPITLDPSGNPATPTIPKLDPNLAQKAIRTFESDLADALAEKKGSSASSSFDKNKKVAAVTMPAPVAPTPTPTTPVPPPRPTVRPVAPTAATAIPGAAISIPPVVERDPNAIETIPDMGAPVIETTPQIPKIQPIETIPSVPKAVVPPKVVVPPQVVVPANNPNVPRMEVPPRRIVVSDDEEPKRSILKPILFTFFSLALIAGGIFVGYTLYVNNSQTKEVAASPTPIVIPSVIPHDGQTSITITNENADRLISKIYAEVNKNTVNAGQNLEVIIRQNSNGVTTRVNASDFLGKLNTHLPNVISRSLTDRWMFGVYGEETGDKTTFIALSTDFFQNAFAGMLQWEGNDMGDDLATLLNYEDKARRDELNASSTITNYFTIQGKFSDKVIKNRDVREFRNAKGELLFLYSFINKETLILTTTESAFVALIDRIEKDSYVR